MASSRTSCIDKDSRRLASVTHDVTESGVDIALSESIPIPESAHLGKVDINGRMRAHLIHKYYVNLCAQSGEVTAAMMCLTHGLKRNSSTGLLRTRTLNNDECVFESRFAASFVIGGQDILGGDVSSRHKERFRVPKVVIQPYFVYANGSIGFGLTATNRVVVTWYLEYEPITLSAKDTRKIIMATTGVGGVIEKRG